MIGKGTQFRVVRGGGTHKLKVGDVWDLVESSIGLQLRELNKNGSSIRLLNGYSVARQEMDAGRLEVVPPPQQPAPVEKGG